MKCLFCVLCFFLLTPCGKSQDTIRINITSADKLFLANNYDLLASSMNISAEQAKVVQAKLYPNPVLTADFNVYDPSEPAFFHAGKTGQKSFQFEQLILLGGKRKKEIEMAKTNAAIAELEFQKLVRQLKFRLHSDLYAVGLQQIIIKKYNQQLALLDTLLFSYQEQAAKGNLPLKDVVRLKGAYLKLNNDRAEVYKAYYEAQTNLQVLIGSKSVVVFEFVEEEVEKYIKALPLPDIMKEAETNRTELKLIEENKKLAEQYFQYQRKSAIPDVNLITSYDQRGGAFLNQVNAGLAFPLPLWNHNQGNIRASGYMLKAAEYDLQQARLEMESEIQNNYVLYLQTVNEYKKAQVIYNKDFETTVNGMTSNFQKRNVSIVEFVDFFEAYNGALTELARIKAQLVVSGEKLNLLIGKDLY